MKRESYIVIFFLFICYLLLIYFHPSMEMMQCNEKYECVITRQYFSSINFTKHLKLTSNSTIASGKIYSPYKGRRSIDKSKVSTYSYDGIKPFVFYSVKEGGYDSIERIKQVQQDEYSKFHDYLNNPQQGYIISSLATKQNTILCLIPLFFIMFIGIIYLFFMKVCK